MFLSEYYWNYEKIEWHRDTEKYDVISDNNLVNSQY